MPHTQNSHFPNQSNGSKPHSDSSASAPSSSDWSSATTDLLEALPRPWTRGLLYFLIAFVAVVLPWAMFYKVEETGTARGRLEPKDGTVKVEAPLSGRFAGVEVANVPVSKGDTVEAGDVLLKLDSQSLHFDLRQAQAQLEGLQGRLSQLKPIQQQLKVSTNTQRLQNQAQVSEKQAQIDQTQRRLNSLKNIVSLEQTRLERAQNNLQRYRQLFEQGVVSERKVEEVESKRDERAKVLKQLRSQIQQASSELSQRKSAHERVKSRGKMAVIESERQLQQLQSQIAELQGNINQTRSRIQSLQHELQQRVIKAPTDGIIFKLPINKSDEVIQANQLVAKIAPQNNSLVLRADIATSESGSLHEGMDVKLKFDAYPYQDYGLVEGELLDISPTSQEQKTAQGKATTFDLEIGLEQSCIPTKDHCIPLEAGDTATAEVVVRERRVIDYVIDPFKKLQEGGIQL